MESSADPPRPDSTASSDLLSRVRASDAHAWSRFTALYTPWVYRLLRSAGLTEPDAADVGQEVFLTAALRINGFQRDGKGASLRRWLAKIVRNKVGDWLRKHARETGFDDGVESGQRAGPAAAGVME